MKRLAYAAALALLAALPSVAQQQPDPGPVHDFERMRHGFGELRPPRDSDQSSPRAANFDEAKVGDLAPPPLFASPADATPEGWAGRRADLVRLVEDNWTGRIPEAAQDLRIVWSKSSAASDRRYDVEQWVGQVFAPDGRGGPTIDATITLPAGKRNVPVVIDYTYVWPPGFRFPGPTPPDPKAMALERGWGHVAYRVQMLQADTAALMEQGLIGLVRWPREKRDWGALHAWGWGASRLREQLAADPRIDGERIGLAGHSRFGKAVLVASAFDHAFADALVSSSGAGGAKLMRRDFGEHWNNMAGSYAYHWYTPNVMEYAGNRPLADLPVDAHMLIALRAPRPLFVSSGLAEKGDDWVDPRGMWIATSLAEPAWGLHGLPVPPGDEMPEVMQGYRDFPLAFFQHDQGHVMWPAFEAFLDHAQRFTGPSP